jgi:hypothetical protein
MESDARRHHRGIRPKRPRKTLLRDGIKAVIAACSSAQVQRLIAVSAAGAYVAKDDPLSRFVAKPILERVLKENNIDTRAMDDAIEASSTECTILRPSRLVTGENTSDYRARIGRSVWWHYNTRFDTVGRAAVDALSRPECVRQAVYIRG